VSRVFFILRKETGKNEAAAVMLLLLLNVNQLYFMVCYLYTAGSSSRFFILVRSCLRLMPSRSAAFDWFHEVVLRALTMVLFSISQAD
jgi:hypothetical protein